MNPSLPENTLRHLGALLRDACTLGDTDRFVALLSRLDAAMADAASAADAAFRADLLAYAPRLLRFALSLTHDPVVSEDLLQDTLLRAWRSRDRFEMGTNIEAWLFTILRNQFYNTARKLGREVSDTEGSYAARLATAPEQDGRIDLEDVRAALDSLTPKMREALVLVAIQDLSYEEAAVMMNCRIGTVKSRVWRARQCLAEALGFTGAEVSQDAITLSAMGALT